jgi:hypothetical protein
MADFLQIVSKIPPFLGFLDSTFTESLNLRELTAPDNVKKDRLCRENVEIRLSMKLNNLLNTF